MRRSFGNRPASILTPLAAVLIATIFVRPVAGGGGPENVFVVVNSASWASQAVANEFVQLRKVPPSNVFYIDWQGGFESVEVEVFREKILGPILKTIDARGLGDQIDYIVYSSDFPVAVDLAKLVEGQQVPPQLAATASLSALTYFWQMVLVRSPAVIGIRNNQYMRAAADREAAPPVHGFRSWYGWGPHGELVDAGGQHYMLSTLLAMTSGRGNSVGEAVVCLRRSAQADGTHPGGTIYYMKNEDVRSVTRAGGFAAAVAQLDKLGVKAVVADGVMPRGRPDVQGAMLGSAGFEWRSSGSTILPGAICENLTSFGGVLREQAGQTPLTEFLRYGAAGASGPVVEPYAIQDKFPVPAIQAYYAEGCSLAEAYYQSVFGPYQLLIVGDPLCRPWANIPKVTVEGLDEGTKVSGTLSIKVKAEVSGGRGVDRLELFVDGRRAANEPADKGLPLDTTQLADGYHELRAVAIERGPIESQGRAVAGVWVDNHEHSIEFSVQPAPICRWDQTLKLRAKAPGMSALVFMHNGRVLGQTQGEEGKIELNCRLLGSGPVNLRAIGIGRRGPLDQVHARPVELTVAPNRPLPSLKSPGNLGRGMLVKRSGGKLVPVQETLKETWLAEAGVKPQSNFELSGYFEIAVDDIYQFQFWHYGSLKLTVDGVALYDNSQGNYGQRFVAVALAKGLHRLELTGQTGESAQMRILFGGPGSRALEGTTFRHVSDE